MAKVLSQDEIDSLLDGIDEGKVQTETDIPDQGETELYNFAKQAGPGHLRMPALRIINERFIGLLRTTFSSATGSIVDASISGTESIRFDDFTKSIPLPASLNIFKMEPLRGFALLVLEGPLIFAFVDTLFGGKGVSPVKIEGKSFTTIEIKIIEKIVRLVLGDLQQAWSNIHKIKMAFTRSEMDPQFATIVAPNDMVIAVKILVELEGSSGLMTLCLPYSTIEPIRKKLSYKFQGERLEIDQNWRIYIEEKVKGLNMGLSCTLGTGKISGRELLKLKVDDVIPLDKKMGEPAIVSIEGIPKFRGYPGSCNNRKAIKIMDTIKKR
jgi:flagellar motor switch protein FliM